MSVLDHLFKSDFTADDIVEILQKRGIKFQREDKNYISVEYADRKFDIFIEDDNRMTIRLVFLLGDEYDQWSTLLAMNKIHSERWNTTLYTIYRNRTDEETGDERGEALLVALYTGMCYSKSNFNHQFDYAIGALEESTQLFGQYYDERQELRNAQQQQPIGFNAQQMGEQESSEAKMKGKKGKIGFV